MVTFENVIESEAELRELLGEPGHAVVAKTIGALDGYCRAFIARSPYLLVASCDAEGNMDVSPKGDPPGFVRVLDDRTLAIPERPGNRRADTYRNVLQNPAVGLIFLIPGTTETLRVSGRGLLVRDRELLESMAHRGKAPKLALAVRVTEAFFHCSKSLIRSHLWQPESWPERDGIPTLAETMVAHGKLPITVDEMADGIADDEENRMY